ncbi:hypothetical protein [Pandoraea terrae]|uniref:hypothetical protein n=1 Tax=Pandoraea terrae TaxID=1537710 RepID=UPI001782C015|nr:hypothetical protein [Pandoraea terrae]
MVLAMGPTWSSAAQLIASGAQSPMPILTNQKTMSLHVAAKRAGGGFALPPVALCLSQSKVLTSDAKNRKFRNFKLHGDECRTLAALTKKIC